MHVELSAGDTRTELEKVSILAILFCPACQGEPGVFTRRLQYIAYHRETPRTWRYWTSTGILGPLVRTENHEAYDDEIEHREKSYYRWEITESTKRLEEWAIYHRMYEVVAINHSARQTRASAIY